MHDPDEGPRDGGYSVARHGDACAKPLNELGGAPRLKGRAFYSPS